MPPGNQSIFLFSCLPSHVGIGLLHTPGCKIYFAETLLLEWYNIYFAETDGTTAELRSVLDRQVFLHLIMRNIIPATIGIIIIYWTRLRKKIARHWQIMTEFDNFLILRSRLFSYLKKANADFSHKSLLTITKQNVIYNKKHLDRSMREQAVNCRQLSTGRVVTHWSKRREKKAASNDKRCSWTFISRGLTSHLTPR